MTRTAPRSALLPYTTLFRSVVAGGGDATPGNNSPSDPTIISQLPDLAMTKTHTGNFTQGQSGDTYNLTVSNVGAGPTSGTVTVTDTLPTGLTATGLAGSGWTCTLATLTCTRSDALAAGASYPPITLTVNLAVNAPPRFTNSFPTRRSSDLTPGNNSPSDPTIISQLPDLAMTKTHTG